MEFLFIFMFMIVMVLFIEWQNAPLSAVQEKKSLEECKRIMSDRKY